MRRLLRRAAPIVALGTLMSVLPGCGDDRGEDRAAPPAPDLERAVEALREQIAERLAADSLIQAAVRDSSHVLVGLRTPLLERIVVGGTRSYLSGTRLHLRPNLVIQESDDVGFRIGPVRVKAGEWHLRVTIERLRANFSADTVVLAVADSNRLDLAIPVEARGDGRARIDFEWDAATATSLICRSFKVSERFAGTVSPRIYPLRGTFLLEIENGAVVARPYQRGSGLVVSPEPTAEAWARVREILDGQNHIFRCGLALSPEGMERSLRELLREGFRFRLPETILKPIPLPTTFREDVVVQNRILRVAVRPVTMRLSPKALWYGADVRVEDGVMSAWDDPPDQPLEEVGEGPASERRFDRSAPGAPLEESPSEERLSSGSSTPM